MPPPPARHKAPPRRRPAEGKGADGKFTVQLRQKGVDRWKAGHPWIYRADLENEPAEATGEAVRVVDQRGWLLGQAFYSHTSKIALRWVSDADGAIDADFFGARIAQADALRRRIFPGSDTYRVVHGDSDLLPGLVIDRYGDFLSIQLMTQATDSRKDLICDLLEAHFKPRGIVNRSDVNSRRLEGLQPEKGVLRGETPGAVPYRVGQITYQLDLLNGQKTGTFLDQRENQLLAAQYAHGEALDCFSYLGGFALQLATRSDRVTAVEISEPAAELLEANAKSNGLDHVNVVTTNAFDFLRDSLDEGLSYDTIVLDPPSFAKNKTSVDAAYRGYKEINLRAMQLLKPGGHLITASCTYHVDEPAFEAMLESAASDAKRRMQIVEKRGAARDHPVLVQLRESRYLKCYVLRRVG